MNEFFDWTLEIKREEGSSMSWLEERRAEWTPAASVAIGQIIEGKTIIIVTDSERKWFEYYILSNINKETMDRPIVPIAALDAFYPHLEKASSEEKLAMIEDMLSLAYSDNYFFWYIGKGNDSRAELAKRSGKNFLWIMDEEMQNSFLLHSYDKQLDVQLLHLFKLFNVSLSGVIFGEVDL